MSHAARSKMKLFKMTPTMAKMYKFTSDAIVDMYLDMNHYWFAESTNSLYGKRTECRKMLVRYLETGKELPVMRHELIYVINNFDREWMPYFKDQSIMRNRQSGTKGGKQPE